MELDKLVAIDPITERLAAARECAWINPRLKKGEEAFSGTALTQADIDDAQARLSRFAPFILRSFPETAPNGGLIESPLTPIDEMRKQLNANYAANIQGQLLLKRDGDLPIAGSVKARGGIYEILKHTEELAMENGLLAITDDYSKLAEESFRDFFSRYKVQVGSTGNLGLSIGIMSAAVGYGVTVHMSADARRWKKELLRSKGVRVIEYASDYSEAVRRGRELSNADPMSYFVDDENSTALFLGYAVAAKRLRAQLEAMSIFVDAERPLFVYLPCGVGGAPGGIAFGLKKLFGDNVHVFFIEPVQAPCMLLGLATGYNSAICVQDVGLTGQTHADGLAVSRPSGFVGGVVSPLLSGGFTVEDYRLYDHMRELMVTENLFIEPSACAAFARPIGVGRCDAAKAYIEKHGLGGKLKNAVHIAWATGGRLVPQEIRREYTQTFLRGEYDKWQS